MTSSYSARRPGARLNADRTDRGGDIIDLAAERARRRRFEVSEDRRLAALRDLHAALGVVLEDRDGRGPDGPATGEAA